MWELDNVTAQKKKRNLKRNEISKKWNLKQNEISKKERNLKKNEISKKIKSQRKNAISKKVKSQKKSNQNKFQNSEILKLKKHQVQIMSVWDNVRVR